MLSTTSPQSENQMQGGLLLNVVVSQSPAIFKLLASKNEALLIRWDPLFVLGSQAYNVTDCDISTLER